MRSTIMSIACSSEISVNLLAGESVRRAPALRFEGPYDRVEVPSSTRLDVPHDFAIEAWVFVDSFAGGHGVFNRWQPSVGDIELTFGIPQPVSPAELPAQDLVPSHTLAAWGFIAPNGPWITAYSTTLPSPGRWHHLAMSYGGGNLKLYVDGARWAMAPGTDSIANPHSRVYLGATARSDPPIDADAGEQFWPPMRGAIADVRMSSIDRYPMDFTPASHLTSDESTLTLWHLDEGSGGLAADSGPNHLDGAIVGAAWADLPSR